MVALGMGDGILYFCSELVNPVGQATAKGEAEDGSACVLAEDIAEGTHSILVMIRLRDESSMEGGLVIGERFSLGERDHHSRSIISPRSSSSTSLRTFSFLLFF